MFSLITTSTIYIYLNNSYYMFLRTKTMLLLLYGWAHILPAYTQTLHLGVGIQSTPYQHLTSKRIIQFHYNNSANESYWIKELKNNQLESLQYSQKDFLDWPPILLPTFYVRYDFKNDLFIESKLYFTYHHNEIATERRIDLNSKPYSQGSILLNYYFFANDYMLAYRFLRTRKVRPFIGVGVNTLYLFDFVTSGDLDNKSNFSSGSVRNKPVLESINNFSPITLLGMATVGVGFRGFSFKVSAETNITGLDNGDDAYFDRLIQASVGIAYHFVSFDLLSNKSKRFVKRSLRK